MAMTSKCVTPGAINVQATTIQVDLVAFRNAFSSYVQALTDTQAALYCIFSECPLYTTSGRDYQPKPWSNFLYELDKRLPVKHVSVSPNPKPLR